MNITTETRHQWGGAYIYVVDPDTQEALRWLTGRKTLSALDIKALEQLGFTITERDDE